MLRCVGVVLCVKLTERETGWTFQSFIIQSYTFLKAATRNFMPPIPYAYVLVLSVSVLGVHVQYVYRIACGNYQVIFLLSLCTTICLSVFLSCFLLVLGVHVHLLGVKCTKPFSSFII